MAFLDLDLCITVDGTSESSGALAIVSSVSSSDGETARGTTSLKSSISRSDDEDDEEDDDKVVELWSSILTFDCQLAELDEAMFFGPENW